MITNKKIQSNFRLIGVFASLEALEAATPNYTPKTYDMFLNSSGACFFWYNGTYWLPIAEGLANDTQLQAVNATLDQTNGSDLFATNLCTAGVTITMPATAAIGNAYCIMQYTTGSAIVVTANTGEMFKGCGLSTATAASITNSSAKKGDCVVVRAGQDTATWIVMHAVGTWATTS